MLAATSIALGQKQSARKDQRRSVDQSIRLLDEERIQAQIHADATALDRIYADDFIGVGPSGTVRSKPQVISDFTSGELKFQSITTDEVQVRIYGNTAVETGRSTMNGQDRGKVVPRDNRFTRVWAKQQGHWRLVLNHYSPLIQPATPSWVASLMNKYNVIPNITYETSNNYNDKLDVYVPRDDRQHPTLLYIHGGGWVSGSKEDRALYVFPF